MIRRRARERDERGAVLVFVAAMALVLMMIGAFAVDLGMQRVARRDMQALADVISLDLARQIDGRTAGEIGGLQTLAERSRDRNSGAVGTGPAQIVPVLGTVDARGAFTAVTSANQVPTAVRVVATTAVDFAFAVGVGDASRAAVATSASTACFSVGSYAARVKSGNAQLISALNSALGGTVNVGSYQALGSAQVSLAELGAELGAVTTEDIGDIRGIQVREFYLALGRVLTRQGATAEARVLNQTIANRVPLPLIFDIAQILTVGQGGGSALDAKINLLDLVAGAAFAATGTNGVSIPILATTIPGFVTMAASMTLVEAPRIGCGPVGSTAQTSQVGVQLSGFAIPQLTLSSYSLTQTRADIQVGLKVASGRASLTTIRCAPESVDLVTASGLVTPDLQAAVSFATSVTGPGGVPLGIKVTVPVTMTTDRPTTAGHAHIDMPPYGVPVTAAPRGGLLSGGIPGPVIGNPTATLSLLGTPYLLSTNTQALFRGAVAGYVAGTLLPNLDAGITAAVRDTLGMDLAGVDVFGLERPNCNSPELISGPSV